MIYYILIQLLEHSGLSLITNLINWFQCDLTLVHTYNLFSWVLFCCTLYKYCFIEFISADYRKHTDILYCLYLYCITGIILTPYYIPITGWNKCIVLHNNFENQFYITRYTLFCCYIPYMLSISSCWFIEIFFIC